ncbi:MAG: SGNH/GDSL hydrolase family protein [Proteiniphilum sp.]|nr:SGNH/GDSL hydrolase family protein [Proteiniphilum sp.]
MKKRPISLLLLLTLLLSTGNCHAKKLIPPTHPAIRYMGRVDRSNPQAVRFDWPGVSVGCRFTGEQIGLRIEGGEKNHFNLFIDGELVSIFSAPRDTTLYFRSSNHAASHELLLTKRTEADMGMTRFRGFILEEKGEILPSPRPTGRRVEFIGNSITCGYGTEGNNRDERFRPDTENNYKSYAAILARAFSAEAHFIAHSGKGAVRNYGDEKPVSDPEETMPGRYGRTLDNDPSLPWDFCQWKADCVVINLGTNDFSTTPHPDRDSFLKAYKELISTVRNTHGNVPVFCVVGPMINEPCFSYIKDLTLYYRDQEKDEQLYFAGLPDNLLNQEDDLGSDWHPSYQGQLKIAAQLLVPIATVMEWDFQSDEIFP